MHEVVTCKEQIHPSPKACQPKAVALRRKRICAEWVGNAYLEKVINLPGIK